MTKDTEHQGEQQPDLQQGELQPFGPALLLFVFTCHGSRHAKAVPDKNVKQVALLATRADILWQTSAQDCNLKVALRSNA